MFRVLVVPRIHQRGLDVLAARDDVAFEVVEDLSEANLKRAMADADGMIVRANPIGREIFEAARRLRVVSRHGVGYNNLPVEYLSERQIPLTLTIEANALSVAEHTLFMLLSLAKNGLVYDRAVRTGNFGIRESLACYDLSGKTLLVIGFGRIGRCVAERAKAFGMTVAVFDPLVPAAAVTAAGCVSVPVLADALPDADSLTVHVPLIPATKGLIGEREIALLKPEATLINTARGGIIDEAAMVKALKAGRIRGAGLDVFEDEPIKPDHPLLKLDNVILSPHSAGLTRECAARMAVASAENVLAGLDNRLDPTVVVNRQVLR